MLKRGSNIMNSFKIFLLNTFTSNNIQRTPYFLIALLTVNMLVVTAVTIGLLYNLGYNRQKSGLIDLVETQSVMIHIVARQALHDRNAHASDAAKHTTAAQFIRQITETYPRYGALGESGEFTLGQRNGENIGFILKQRYFDIDNQLSIPWTSSRAEPMRRALKGEQGADVMLDYRGVHVLAAYKYIPDLKWGIVAKIDLDEIRAPYIQAATYALLFTLILSIGSSIIFWFFLNPLIHEIEESREFNRILISKSSTGLVLCSFDGQFIDANDSFLKIVGYPLEQLWNDPKKLDTFLFVNFVDNNRHGIRLGEINGKIYRRVQTRSSKASHQQQLCDQRCSREIGDSSRFSKNLGQPIQRSSIYS
jgi:PAS domain-containing protein